MTEIAILSLGVFLGAFVSGFSGFAFSPVAGLFVFVLLPPALAVPLLMACSIILQSASLVFLRRSLQFTGLGPMLMGGAAGTPVALMLFQHIDGGTFTLTFAWFLAAYAVAMLARPRVAGGVPGGPAARAAVGFTGGVIGGLTAMPGAAPVIYSDLRGDPKEVQRAMVQPFILAMQVLSTGLMAATGLIGWEVLRLLALCLPALATGGTLGLALFGRAPAAGFRRAVLLILLGTSLLTIAHPPGGAPASQAPPETVTDASPRLRH